MNFFKKTNLTVRLSGFVASSLIAISAPAGSSLIPSTNEVVKFGISPTYDVPVLIMDSRSGAMTGIAIDIIDHVAKKMNVRSDIVQLPRNRIEKALPDGEIDVICYSNPAWTRAPELSVWSNAIFDVKDYIVRFHKAPQIKSLTDLKGQTVGAVAGYYYEKIMPLFKSNFIQRSDFFDPEGMFKRIELGQIHYGIINQFFLQYSDIKLNPNEADLQEMAHEEKNLIVSTGLVEAHNKIYCRTAKSGRIDMKRINKALENFQLKSYSKKNSLNI